MKEFKILRLLDKFQGLYKKSGVNYDVMRMILQIKLTMDGRRVSTVLTNGKKSDENDDKNNYVYLLLFNGFLSFFIGLIMMSNMEAFRSINIVIGVTLFMMVSLMISDFSAVLLDVKEKNILLPKPIDSKTFNAAKLTHICLYLMGISLSLNFIPLILGTIKYGVIFFLIFTIENILSALIVIVLTALLYTLVLKFFDGEKLKDIINYFQILLTFVFTFGYQLFSRMFAITGTKTDYVPKIWHSLIPSMWFAAPFGILIDGDKNYFLIVLSLMAILGPIVLIIFYVTKVVPYFEKNLQKLNENGGNVSGGSRRKEFMAKIICRDKLERSMFIFTKNMIATERTFKLKVYPSLAAGVFIPILFIFTDRRKSFWETIQTSFGGKVHLLMYMTVLMLCFCTVYINNSDNYKGAFIYKVLPIKDPGIILKGAIKGTLFKLVIPIYLLVAGVFLILKGPSIIIDLIAMFLVLMISALIYFKMSNKTMPFSVKFAVTDSGKLIAPGIFTMILIGIFSAIHVSIRNNIIFLGIFVFILLVANIVVWKISFRIGWRDIDM
ncbi:hypothetical protein NNC19_11635 [Clostridium sp. SHJSY1]|uniref:hypothetical protein n=1 Tax=Clostridium sp. SHJSY1 TaxID=2942483 RepID=UPI0028742716|nr:hypothetical protein [Clostridium sp. SHJSY1]MDS0526333.1 hypothetical protein [Clostridium sp. SHJSY1]